jgi:multicomponent Na+:H+ antiporter subunit E
MLFVTTYILLLVIWVVFSGLLDPFHLTLGAISCLIVSLLSTRVLFPKSEPNPLIIFKRSFFLVQYLLWLLKEILIANIHVFYLAIVPGGIRHLDPSIVEMKIKLQSEAAKYLLANSITLTPGTVTISIEGDRLLVHSISRTTTEGLGGNMERKIARVFGEKLPNS